MRALGVSKPATATTGSTQRGAVIVEFALVLPLLMMLVLGMVTAGIALDRGQSLAHGAREASRFGATLPSGPTWLAQVADTARTNAAGNVDASVPGRYLCVALIPETGPVQRSVEGGPAPAVPGCFADDLGSRPRVQVVTGREVEFDALIFRRTLTLRKQAVTLFEATP
jgi:Flp pilus assembly protein TadG